MTKQTVICVPEVSLEPGSIYDCLPIVPETHLLFAGPLACARHGLLSGANYHKAGRISYLLTNEAETASGAYIKKLRRCAGEILAEKSPRALFIMLCCSDVIISTDTDLLRETMEDELGIPVRFLTVNRLNMYCGGDKRLMLPTQTEIIFSLLKRAKAKKPMVNLIGTLSPKKETDALFTALKTAGFAVGTVSKTKTFDEFLSLSEASLNLALNTDASAACAAMEKTLGIPWLPFYSSMHLGTMSSQYEAISQKLNTPIDVENEKAEAAGLMEEITAALNAGDVVINGGMMKNPWSLCRELYERGVFVSTLYYTRFSGKEPEHREILSRIAPHLNIVKADDIVEKLPPLPERRKRPFALLGFFQTLDDLRYLKESLS